MAIPDLFFVIFSSCLNVRYNFLEDEWIRSVNFCSRKGPLYQLSHNHCPGVKLADLMENCAAAEICRCGKVLATVVEPKRCTR